MGEMIKYVNSRTIVYFQVCCCEARQPPPPCLDSPYSCSFYSSAVLSLCVSNGQNE